MDYKAISNDYVLRGARREKSLIFDLTVQTDGFRRNLNA